MSILTLKAPKRVSSGKYLDLANLSVDDINIEDINSSLNLIYRFTGHYKNRKPLTVAQHTKLVMYMARLLYPEETVVEFDCLLHDFGEAYTGDVATPLKRLFGSAYKDYEHHVEETVYDALWKLEEPFTEEIYHKRKICDLLALDVERRAMWSDQRGKDLWPDIPREGILSLNEKIAVFDEIQSQGDVDLIGMYNGF